jgi:serine/threonine protein kinase/predicted Zn-dependent protease
MFGPQRDSDESLAPEVAARINPICYRFESEWKQGRQPLIEECLSEVSRTDHDCALVELLLLELTYRERRGEKPSRADYKDRFPSREIELAFAQRAPLNGKYKVVKVISETQMSVVFKAMQIGLDRPVALKMIRPSLAVDEDEVQRFYAEAKAATTLRHSNIVEIYDVFNDGGRNYISMAYEAGGTLNDLVGHFPREPKVAAKLIETVARAVQFAHSKLIVHRDLKPKNVLLTLSGEPKVTDFGLAKRQDDISISLGDELSEPGPIEGTPEYMAPEQARGERQIGPLADVYALGGILFYLITRAPPFHDAFDTNETLRMVVEEDPPSPRQVNPAVDRDLEAIILKCLQKSPDRRYTSADAVADDLGRFQRGEPVLARDTPFWERAWKLAKRRPAAVTLVAALILLAFSLGFVGIIHAQLADERSRLADKELEERRSLDLRRDKVQKLINDAERSANSGSFQKARASLREALGTIEDQSALEAEQARIEQLLQDVDHKIVVGEERAATLQRLAEFERHRDSALFHGSQVFGADPRENQKLAVDEAVSALKQFGLDDQSQTSPDIPDAYFTSQQQQRIKEQCYELLLIVADVSGQSALETVNQDELRHSIEILDQAKAVLKRTTKAFHLQRAEYRAGLHETTEGRDAAVALADATPQTAVDYFLLGKLALRSYSSQPNALEEASKHFEAAIQADSHHFWAKYYLAMCCLHLGKPGLAKAHLSSCITQQSSDFACAWSHILRGSAESQLEQFESAERDFDQACNLQPDEDVKYATLVNRGAMDFKRNRLATAVDHLCAAIALREDDFQARVNLAQVYQRQERLTDALVQLNEAAKHHPRESLIYRERARILQKLNRAAEAARDLELAAAGSPPTEKADDLTKLAELRCHQQRYVEALATVDEALVLVPDLPEAHFWRGAILVELKRYSEAIQSFDRYTRWREPGLELYITRGLCRASMANFVGAIDDYSRAIELKPDAAIYNSRGWLYALSGSLRIALDDFERALQLDSKRIDPLCGRGLVLVGLGRVDDAVKDAKSVLERGPQTSQSAYKVACIFALASVQVAPTTDRNVLKVVSLRQEYKRQALDLLEQAVLLAPLPEREPFWRNVIEADIHLLPLRGTLEFKQLRAKLLSTAAAPRQPQT